VKANRIATGSGGLAMRPDLDAIHARWRNGLERAHLASDVPVLLDYIRELEGQLADEGTVADTRLEKVQALHRPAESTREDGQYCAEDGFVWPCRTAAVLREVRGG
jgi:hypothetical protein